jgi:putative FmdB family regulatory protein
MPIYEYACKRCGHVFDALQKMTADPLIDCPDCGKPALKKMLSAPNFHLKGGGWYATDFKKNNQRDVAEGVAKKDAKDGTDSKPAEKGDTPKAAESKSNDSAGKTNGGNSTGSKSAD